MSTKVKRITEPLEQWKKLTNFPCHRVSLKDSDRSSVGPKLRRQRAGTRSRGPARLCSLGFLWLVIRIIGEIRLGWN